MTPYWDDEGWHPSEAAAHFGKMATKCKHPAPGIISGLVQVC